MLPDFAMATEHPISTPERASGGPLFGLDLDELAALLQGLGQKRYRAVQLHEALYRQRVETMDQVSVLPAALRGAMLSAGYRMGLPEIAQTARSVDGTERYLMRMADGETVETVWMPDGDGGERDDMDTEPEQPVAAGGYRRATICVSSQVGCAVNCQFCLTAKLGIRRNLTAGEIAGQVAAVLNRHAVSVGKQRINLVFMGMGEPFLNYAEFIKAVRLLVVGVGLPESRMTVSTSGIEPAIRAFALEAIRPKLALSLNASNDTVREQIMPITRKWNIAKLLEAVQTIPLRTREWITFEYVLLGGINDQPEHAREVLALLAGVRSKVNLIVWNPGPGIAYTQPLPEDVSRFQALLMNGGIATYIRRPRGRDIYAACGQLKRTIEPAPEPPLVAIGLGESSMAASAR